MKSKVKLLRGRKLFAAKYEPLAKWPGCLLCLGETFFYPLILFSAFIAHQEPLSTSLGYLTRPSLHTGSDSSHTNMMELKTDGDRDS